MDIKVLEGQTLSKIHVSDDETEIIFTAENGNKYKMHHNQDCCERVYVDDVCGDIDDLIGSPIIEAEESTSSENPAGGKKEYQDDSFTWTFYNLRTEKGSVTIRWYGESNGYYSESVELVSL